MGGPGSTRWKGHRRKASVDGTVQIDVGEWLRQGVLRPGWCTEGQWRACYPDRPSDSILFSFRSLPSSPQVIRIRLTIRNVCQELCVFSQDRRGAGRVWWFLCPSCTGHNAGLRRARLYLPAGASRFACRDCHDLSYRSSQDKAAWCREGKRPDCLRKRLSRLSQEPVWMNAWPGPQGGALSRTPADDSKGTSPNRSRELDAPPPPPTNLYNAMWDMAISTDGRIPSVHEFVEMLYNKGAADNGWRVMP